MELLNLLFSSGGGVLHAALLIGLFWAALAHPDRIRSLVEFRCATILLAIAIVVPFIIQCIGLMFQDTQSARSALDFQSSWIAMTWGIPPVLTMLAIILGLDSVTPRSKSKLNA